MINKKNWQVTIYDSKGVVRSKLLLTDSEMIKYNENLNSGRSSYNRTEYDYRMGYRYSQLITFKDLFNDFKTSYRIENYREEI